MPNRHAALQRGSGKEGCVRWCVCRYAAIVPDTIFIARYHTYAWQHDHDAPIPFTQPQRQRLSEPERDADAACARFATPSPLHAARRVRERRRTSAACAYAQPWRHAARSSTSVVFCYARKGGRAPVTSLRDCLLTIMRSVDEPLSPARYASIPFYVSDAHSSDAVRVKRHICRFCR